MLNRYICVNIKEFNYLIKKFDLKFNNFDLLNINEEFKRNKKISVFVKKLNTISHSYCAMCENCPDVCRLPKKSKIINFREEKLKRICGKNKSNI